MNVESMGGDGAAPYLTIIMGILLCKRAVARTPDTDPVQDAGLRRWQAAASKHLMPQHVQRACTEPSVTNGDVCYGDTYLHGWLAALKPPAPVSLGTTATANAYGRPTPGSSGDD